MAAQHIWLCERRTQQIAHAMHTYIYNNMIMNLKQFLLTDAPESIQIKQTVQPQLLVSHHVFLVY